MKSICKNERNYGLNIIFHEILNPAVIVFHSIPFKDVLMVSN